MHQDSNIIKKSLIKNAGNGLFANKSYKKGDYVCFYDGVYKSIESITDFDYSIVNKFNGNILVGYNTIKKKNGVGQFINDFNMFELTDEDRDDDGYYKVSSYVINEKIQYYTQLSTEKQNICFSNDKKNIFITVPFKKTLFRFIYTCCLLCFKIIVI